MVDVQMRTHDEVDVGNGETDCRQPAHPGVICPIVERRVLRPVLVVADATIDQDGVMRRLHDVRLETKDQPVLGIERMGLQPGAVLGQQLRREAWDEFQRGPERNFHLDNPVDRQVGDAERGGHGGSIPMAVSGL